MKNLILVTLLATTCITACHNENTSEVAQKRQELEAKRAELKEKQELAALDSELEKVGKEIDNTQPKPVTEAVSYKIKANATQGRIVGVSVIVRSAASVQSAKLDNFTNNEVVTILSRTGASSGNEAIITQDIQLYSYTNSGKTPVYLLPKGKAVIIQEYLQSRSTYRVTYQHPEMGALTAEVGENLLANISSQTWYQVRRTNGQTGWVLGNFLREL